MAGLAIVENAVIVPSTEVSGGLGVLDADGRFVAESTIWRDDAPLFAPPEPLEPEDHIEGTHLFAGIMSWHFGHFLVESLSRLWPIEAPPEAFASALFVPKGPADRERSEYAFQTELLDMLAPGLPRRILTRPTRVARLIVPEQGFGTGTLEAGTPEFRAFLQGRNWPEPEGDTPERIYVTRSGLDRRKKGRVLGDVALQKFLRRRGFRILRPEKTPLHEQIRLYRGAKRLLFDDGSAVHLFGLVARPRQVAASIQRRFAGDAPAIGALQLRAMADVDLKAFDAVLREWRPAALDRATAKSHGELDPRHLFEALSGYGATATGDSPETMGLPTQDEVAADMAGLGYVAAERDAPLAEPPALARFWGVEIPEGSHLDQRKVRSLRDGFYERQEVLSAFAHFRPEDRVLELGAGAGIVGSAVALNCGVEALLSFEANPDMVPVARALYARNRLQGRVEIRHGIVVTGEDAPSAMSFAVAEDYLGSMIVPDGTQPGEGMRIERVPTVNLAAIAAEFRPTALLMDIEGGELPLLEGADLSIFRVVVVEFHRDIYGRDGMKRCRAALTEAGLRPDPDFCRRGVEAWVRS
ncbi:FkbM family methyltransferase [Roseibacterium sp. SDUM158016]|uniref:FkbM family methyltransferase n=1 Tax=Roseicyclus sediminis TaxID=2980997 RepID=UPI0021D20691|nr:FkbM family methyltransferase [Roseibacterium sp. SDUM158016]MCU4653240.1 FkbM family methyltransferase [Roseibacterium sp. SDUM158016]